jgi:hypothetical protein
MAVPLLEKDHTHGRWNPDHASLALEARVGQVLQGAFPRLALSVLGHRTEQRSLIIVHGTDVDGDLVCVLEQQDALRFFPARIDDE